MFLVIRQVKWLCRRSKNCGLQSQKMDLQVIQSLSMSGQLKKNSEEFIFGAFNIGNKLALCFLYYLNEEQTRINYSIEIDFHILFSFTFISPLIFLKSS